MFHKILVPLDGTPAAEHALPWALAIAERTEASITLAQVHNILAPILVGTEMAGDLAVDQTLREHEREHLSDLAARLSADGTQAVSWEVLEGSTVEELRDFANRSAIDLVVMATHARGPLARLLLGSVADKLVRRVEKPTLLIRPANEEAPDLAWRPALTRIWVPLDGSALAEEVLGAAEELARLTGAPITLLSIADGNSPETAQLVEHPPALPEYVDAAAGAQNARQYLEAIAGRLKGKVAGVQTRVVVNRPVVPAILEQVTDPHSELVALATHGRGGLARVMFGSIADELLRNASCPVLLYRPR